MMEFFSNGARRVTAMPRGAPILQNHSCLKASARGELAPFHQGVPYFRQQLKSRGVTIREGTHAIVPILIGDTAKAISMSKDLLDEGVYVSGFGFPVVPQGQARLRCQISAAHTREHLDTAINAISNIAEKYGVLAAAVS